MTAAKNQDVKIRISYTIDSDNYADNLYDFLKIKKVPADQTAIHHCDICDRSEIVLKVSEKSEVKIYPRSEAKTLNLRQIKMLKDEESSSIFEPYLPKVVSL